MRRELVTTLAISLEDGSKCFTYGAILEATDNYDATALLQGLAAQKLTAVSVLHAFRKRPSIAQQLTNCLTKLHPEVVQDAKAADEHIQRVRDTLGP
ncbi:hypothetical protein DER45DRAFT_615501 [Fusarium avenaceum]|nr:hypothetical protein DER45DRAFT_615501 [Fusarium avenaceum]